MILLDSEGNSSFSKSSSDKWFDLYMDSKLYQKCHLMQEATKQIKNHDGGFTFLWDNYFPVNEESQCLNRLREEHHVAHGVAFCTPLAEGNKLIITVTGKHHDVNFAKNVLKNKRPIYQATMKSLIE